MQSATVFLFSCIIAQSKIIKMKLKRKYSILFFHFFKNVFCCFFARHIKCCAQHDVCARARAGESAAAPPRGLEEILQCMISDGGNKQNVRKGKKSLVLNVCEVNGFFSKSSFLPCVIYQPAKCRMYVDMSCVMKPVALTISFIPSHSLHHRQRYFLVSLAEIESCPIKRRGRM